MKGIGVQGMQDVANSVASMGLSNFGGVMFWDVSLRDDFSPFFFYIYI